MMKQKNNISTIASKSVWQIVDQKLIYNCEDNTSISPTAKQIWESIFGGKINFQTNPDSVLIDYEFSRFPAEPALLLTGRSPENIRINLIGKIKNEFAVINDWKTDQVFIGKTWCPFDIADYEDSLSTLKKQDISFGHILTVGQLIWLKTQINLGIELIDHLENCTPASAQAPSDLNTGKWGLKGELYSYQKDGVHFLRLIANQSIGCIIGDEMGLGKTIQVITLMLAEKSEGRSPTLIIAPATLLENWRRELVQFAPSIYAIIHAGANRAGIASRLAEFDAVITSYDTVIRDEPMISEIRWNIIALDEAQNIKNPDAQRTIAVKKLPRRVSLAITGTPVENKLTDLWSLADFALPGLLGECKDFEKLFSNSNSDASHLAPLIAPILLRRKVKDVAKDLPERIDIPQPIQMSKEMAEIYEQVRLDALKEYGNSGSLVALQRLRMFCTDPRLLGYDKLNSKEDIPKYVRLLELLEEIFSQEEKCLIFTSYTEMTNIFLKYLPVTFGKQYFNFIDGRVDVPKRQPIVDEFSESSSCGALILNPKAGGVGLNITAANHVIHYNPEWNPAVIDQASARAYRRKQKRPVTIHQLFYADSVEEIVFGRLHFKRGLAENAVKGHKGDATASEVMQALNISPLSNMGMLQ